MRGTPLIAPLRQPGTKQRWTALWRSALFSSTRLRSKNLMSGCTCRPFIPVCTGSGSGMQNPLANSLAFSLSQRCSGLPGKSPMSSRHITRSDRQIGNQDCFVVANCYYASDKLCERQWQCSTVSTKISHCAICNTFAHSKQICIIVMD